jgi:hypothetical protein
MHLAMICVFLFGMALFAAGKIIENCAVARHVQNEGLALYPGELLQVTGVLIVVIALLAAIIWPVLVYWF